MTEIPAILGVSQKTWRSVPQEDRSRNFTAVSEGSISVAKGILKSLDLGNPNSNEIIESTEDESTQV